MKKLSYTANVVTLLVLAFIGFSSFKSTPMETQEDHQDMLGEVRIWMGYYEPLNWRFCEGQEIEKARNENLFNVIGSRFGGDGTTTFKLPDLTSQRIINLGVDNEWDPENNMGKYIICTKGANYRYWDSWNSHYDDGIPTGW